MYSFRIIFVLYLLVALSGRPLSAQEKGLFRNDICLPSKLYMLSDTVNRLFTEPMLKRWRPYNEVVRFSGNSLYVKRVPREAVITDPQEGMLVTADLVNTDAFEVLRRDTAVVCVGRRAMGKQEVTVQILGDSYVAGAFYQDALLTKGHVPGIRLVGLRKVRDAAEQYDEGRGGWTVKKYFEIPKGDGVPYQGYMQPANGYRYWGSCGFWKNAWRVKNGELKDFESVYNCGRYDRCLPKFDAASGYLLKPKKDDLMYDGKLGSYVLYTGKKWQTVSINESEWRFDYGKYLEMWQVEAPEFFAVLLGLNDYRDSLTADYSEWNLRMAEMKESYQRAVPRGKFVLLMPCSTCGSLDNRRGDFTWRQNAAMWQLRQNILRTFDCREQEGFYVVDIALSVDSEGYWRDREGLQTGNPHPYLSYSDMGVPLAAFIQYHRSR